MTRTRRIILFIVLAFVIYAVYNDPALSASYVQDAFQFVASAIRSVFSFFGELLK